ncbi:hypothetical protein AB0B50_00300 [Streptomyces sp. NPDC041068]|uniref:hypothetical protein n=1 Tax=Streptomyces sp. NPDC041068 TaxID=3155130 RepID=UPI0033DC4278
MRRTLLTTLTITTALSGLPATQAVAVSPAAAPRAAAQAGPEQHCGRIHTLSGGRTNKANVRLCAKVGKARQFMTIATGSNCWNLTGTWKHCDVTGTWKMLHDGEQVARGTVNRSLPYVGPGTYTVVADVSVHAHNNEPLSGTHIEGTVTSTFTLTSPKKDLPFTVEVTPKHRDAYAETPIRFTVASNGEAEGELELQGHGISSATPGCGTAKWDEGRSAMITCEISKGEKKTVELTARTPTADEMLDECAIHWQVEWSNGSQGHTIHDTIHCR